MITIYSLSLADSHISFVGGVWGRCERDNPRIGSFLSPLWTHALSLTSTPTNLDWLWLLSAACGGRVLALEGLFKGGFIEGRWENKVGTRAKKDVVVVVVESCFNNLLAFFVLSVRNLQVVT